MIDNTSLFRQMLSSGMIQIEDSPFLTSMPTVANLPVDPRKVEGMLLGIAIGDALGNTTESQTPAARLAIHGWITTYLPNQYANWQAKGVPSDDTQLSFWTLEQLLIDGGLMPGRLAERFCRQRIFGIGSSVRQFLGNFREHRVPWEEAGPASAGNGALMRIAPVLLPHLGRPSSALWADAVLAGMVTHNDRASNAACASFTRILWEALQMAAPPCREWWLDTYIETASSLEGRPEYSSRMANIDYTGPVWEFTSLCVSQALAKNTPVVDACNAWGSGAYLLETLPSILHILTCHGDDPQEAILQSVNNTYDNDTVAAVVGAVMGAMYGRAAFRPEWVDNLTGRTGEEDDGAVFDLVSGAKIFFLEQDRDFPG